MKKEAVHIAEPCSADWNEMHGDERRRFCDHCTKHVHDLSAMNRDEAASFLEEHAERDVCVQYLHDDSGEVVFRDDADQSWKLFWQRDGLQRLVAAAALVLPMSLAAGCDQKQTTVTAQPHAPIQIQDNTVKLSATKSPPIHTEPAETVPTPTETTTETQPGSGRAPTFPVKQTTPTTPPRVVHPVAGGIRPAPVRIKKGELPAQKKTPDTKSGEGDGKSCDDGEEKTGEEAKTTPTETSVSETQPVRHILRGRVVPKNRYRPSKKQRNESYVELFD